MRVPKKDMQRVRAHLEKLRTKNKGVLTREIVVEDAKKKLSPLHRYFEWDVKKAAEQHWLHTAGQLIASVQVEVVYEEKVVKVPVYLNDPVAPGYSPVVDIQNDEEKAHAVMMRDFEAIAAKLHRARVMAELLGLSDELEDLIKRLQRFKAKAKKKAA